ncbi:MAG: prenyltransferase/squalene oxidase repeat-containing protein [Bdellovibrionota bacterium]
MMDRRKQSAMQALGKQPEAGVASKAILTPAKRPNRFTLKSIVAAMILTIGSGVGVPKPVTDALGNLSPEAAIALGNLDPRTASAEPDESEQLKYSPQQLEELKKYGVDVSLQTRVNLCIEKAKQFLVTSFDQGERSWQQLYNDKLSVGGQHALATLAVLVSDEDPSNKIIQDALNSKQFKQLDSRQQTYSYSVAGLVWVEYIRSLQIKYPNAKDVPTGIVSLKDSKKALQEIVRFLVKKMEADGGWRYPGGSSADTYNVDVSNTQFAIHTLYEAKKLGLRVPNKIFMKTLEYLLNSQEKHGPAFQLTRESSDPRYAPIKQTVKARGWGYTAEGKASGAMTVAGFMTLLEIKDIILDDSKLQRDLSTLRKIDESCMDAYAWLTKEFRVDTNPVIGGDWKFYYLYGLEKVSDLLGIQKYTQTLDDGRNWERFWYKEGAEHLTSTQVEDGTWDASNPLTSKLTSTAFALLFLKRVTRSSKNFLLPDPPTTTGNQKATAR